LKIFGYDISLRTKSDGESIDTILSRLTAAQETFSGITVTPENCMKSPTVNSIVTAISRRIATLPVKVMERVKGDSPDRVRMIAKPDHPVQKLLHNPNRWSDRTTFWLDTTSWLVRYGNVYYYKSRGRTGPVRELIPLMPSGITIQQDFETLDIVYRASQFDNTYREYQPEEILHARGPARDGICGDSPVRDIAEAIGLEITAERMGASVFGNAAMPSIVFKHGSASRGFKNPEEEKKFIETFQAIYAKKGRFRSMVVPWGMEIDTVETDNEKAQFIATRQYQRTVIAGAWNVPPHMVGDLSRGTFNNVEQQSLDFVINVVLPYIRMIESALEKALLTPQEREQGTVIRFDLSAALRGDFKTRQEGLKIQREMGVINPNDWREIEDMNPISEEDGGETYWVKGPSGQGPEPDPTPAPGQEGQTDGPDA
jgi:HK97 family phage portal protein